MARVDRYRLKAEGNQRGTWTLEIWLGDLLIMQDWDGELDSKREAAKLVRLANKALKDGSK